MVQEFMGIPEIKGLVTEIAKDAAKRSADAVRNEAFNKVQKDFDSKFDKLNSRFDSIEKSVGLERTGDESGGDGSVEGALQDVDAIRRRMAELDQRAKQLEEREKEIAEAAEETRKAGLESYRKGVVAEFGLQKVAHMVHGDSEDDIDDSVVEARKALNVIRREFIKEFKEKGWSPPPEELGDDESAATGSNMEQPTDLRKRFNYGPQQTQGQQQIIAP